MPQGEGGKGIQSRRMSRDIRARGEDLTLSYNF